MASLQEGVWTINPLLDARWPEFIKRHQNSSIFHTIGWLDALRATYGYEPVAFTTSPPSAELTNALLFCVVESWFTGRRLVSLPFSDHCDLLIQDVGQLRMLCTHIESVGRLERWKYVEMRTIGASLGAGDGFMVRRVYKWHRINLLPSLDTLYKGFHNDCIRRRIQHAERQGLRCEEGRGDSLVRSFYALVVKTRLRKRLPPQPFEWFQNLVTCMGENVCIRVAFKNDRPVAGILTMTHGKKTYYKYGASSAADNKLGATPMLFWQAIQAAKRAGMEELDLGRSDLDNHGLIRFKERWSAEGMPLNIWRAPAVVASPVLEYVKLRSAKAFRAWMPDQMLILAGRLLYRHVG